MKLFVEPNAHRVIEGCIEQISRCDLYFVINRKTWAFYNTHVESFMASLTMSGIRRIMTNT